MDHDKKKCQVVIVGGGAAGLELAIRLVKNFHREKNIQVTLVDESLRYIWKPLYNEVAAGTVDIAQDEINYITYAHRKGLNFVLGSFCGLDKQLKQITISPVLDDEKKVIIPQRQIPYDYLVIAVGSVSNSFGIPGVKENCYFLDKLVQAERFQRNFLYEILAFIQTHEFDQKELNVVIVGGGATGVELAAELKYALSKAIHYGSKPSGLVENLKISIVEGAKRILPNLSEEISVKVTKELREMGIVVIPNQRVTKALATGLETASELFLTADVMVWSAGIKAPDFLAELNLEVNSLNQLIVKQNLLTSNDYIFALGDCAACMNLKDNTLVPPRAQAARQQAAYLAKSFKMMFKGQPVPDFVYKDYGSLVSLSRKNVVGNLMGKVGNFFIEGKLARLSYLFLHKEHQATLFGIWKTFLLTVSNVFTRKIKSGIKLH
ncbi:MAG: NAD(P)/FAD-dependent oxidoreductase [Gammaproteobacteria bacterium]|nr:NAD(P)/FAD-dependent oxidoreductase [Gammaproteobacteria bacterium]